MERPYFNRGGRAYYQRTYIVGGRSYAYAYSRYSYHGSFYFGYAPAFDYRPAFYGWAFSPWAAPVYYHWGWFGAAWSPFGYYFAPAPYYPVASLWLTDIRWRRICKPPTRPAPRMRLPMHRLRPPKTLVLTPEIKQAIAEEVKRELEAERAAAANPSQPAAAAREQAPAALDPATRVFVVSSAIDVTSGGQGCSLTSGDIITRIDDTPGREPERLRVGHYQ